MEKITEYLIRSTVNSSEVRAWEETVMLPTYEIGKEEKNPIFLEKRVYQGSSGAVYPYPVVEKISDEKKDKAYRAFFIENESFSRLTICKNSKRNYIGRCVLLAVISIYLVYFFIITKNNIKT